MLEWIWSEDFWFPENVTWADVTNGPDKQVVYAEFGDLWMQAPVTLFILVSRYIVINHCCVPLGKWLNLSHEKRKAPPNTVLESEYEKSYYCKDAVILAKRLDMSERQVERWWRLRRSEDKPSNLLKFSHIMWKAILYLFNFALGLYILWDKEWLWDVQKCFVKYPHQFVWKALRYYAANYTVFTQKFILLSKYSVISTVSSVAVYSRYCQNNICAFQDTVYWIYTGITRDIKFYYTFSSSIYWYLAIMQFSEVRRKDTSLLFAHHHLAIAMTWLSWVGHAHRIGSLVQLLHDSSDVMLEVGKTAKYGGAKAGVVSAMFGAFAVIWVTTRLVLYPYIISYAYKTIDWSPMTFTLFSSLCLMLPLHLFWTGMIIKTIYRSITTSKVPGDTRNSSSDEN